MGISDAENEARINKIYSDLSAKGAKNVWNELTEKVQNNFNSIQEAENANLPTGTIIYVNGRKAVIE